MATVANTAVGTGWRVRRADAQDEGRAVSFERLARAVADGKWTEEDQVRGPGERQWQLIGEHPALADALPPKPLFRSRPAEEANMDMTPMIDVVFQLLIFFMIAATYLVQKTLDMPSPEPGEGAAQVTMEQLEKNNVMVKVAADRSITVQGQPAALASLADVLRKAAKEVGTAEVVLDVDDSVDHETVVQVMDAAGAAQIEKVHFVARGGPSGG